MNIAELRPLFLENKDVVLFEHLLETLKHGNCSAFVGAGLSSNYGYPLTHALLSHLQDNSDVSSDEMDGCSSFMERADLLKSRMGRRFFETLFARFNPDHFDVDSYGPIHEYLINLPFKSYVTTNYDDCIRNAAAMQDVQFEEVQTYPNLSVRNLDLLALYHIHGRIDFIDPDRSSSGIVFTSETYEDAYSPQSKLPLLLNAIFDSHDFLFLGFGLEEPTLEEVLARCKQRDEALAQWDSRPERERRRYALLHVPETHRPVDGMDQEQSQKIEANIKSIRQRDEILNRDYGIMVIRYYANDHHAQLDKIVKFMFSIFGKRPKSTNDLSRLEATY